MMASKTMASTVEHVCETNDRQEDDDEANPNSFTTTGDNHIRQRSGLRKYTKKRPMVWVTLIFGLSLIFILFGFTYWLASRPVLECAPSSKCQVSPVVAYLNAHLGVVQGVVTLLFLAGLTCMVSTAGSLYEAGLWIVLSRQPFTIVQLESYIAVAQGSLMAVPSLVFALKSTPAVLLLSLMVVSILTSLTGPPLVGYVYDTLNISVQIQSEWLPGGGIARIFVQSNPPASIQDGAISLYSAWSRGISVEPMSDYRDYYVNRKALADRGNMTVNAVRMQKYVTCTGVPLEQINISEQGNGMIEFASRMKEQNSRGQNKTNSDTVRLRTYAALNVWADSFTFKHANRTSGTLIFASANGVIEGGITSIIRDAYIKSISAIKCDVDIEFIDDTLVVGNGGIAAPVATLSSNDGIHIGHCNTSQPIHHCDDPKSGATNSSWPGSPNTLNEVILFFVMSPLMVVPSVDGYQPQFQSQRDRSLLPLAYTSSDVINNDWTMAEINALINVSISAMAIQSSTNFRDDHEPIDLISTVFTKKLSLERSPLLLILMGVLFACVVSLALLNHHLHNKYNLPVMRGGPLAEILRSIRTHYMQSLIDPDARNWHQHGTLGDVAVMFGVFHKADGDVEVGLGSPTDVQRFRRGPGRRTSEVARLESFRLSTAQAEAGTLLTPRIPNPAKSRDSTT